LITAVHKKIKTDLEDEFGLSFFMNSYLLKFKTGLRRFFVAVGRLILIVRHKKRFASLTA